MSIEHTQNQAICDLYDAPEGIYALAHSVGPMCKSARASLSANFLKPWQHLGGDAWPQWLQQIEGFNQALASLLQADANNFCPQPSVSIAFSQWLCAQSKQRLSQNRRVVLMHQDAFASLGFAVKGLCHTYDLELKLISARANDLEAWEQALSQTNVFACLITHAHSNTGELSDVEAIANIAKQQQVMVAVDIAQSVGIIPIDLRLWQVDCVVGSCVKWLSGGPGAAFLYLPEALANNLEPEHLAWFSHENPFEFDIRNFVPAKGVMRFWGGTPSIAPYAMASAAIGEHNRFTTEVFRQHNQALMRRFLNSYPYMVPEHYTSLIDEPASAPITNSYSGTLCLPLPQNKADKICDALTQASIKFDQRNGQIRLSFSAINQYSDVDKVNEVFQGI